MDWLREVDWTRSNVELAEKYEVRCWQVRNYRLRFFRMLRWRGSNKKYGVSSTHLWRMRKKYGVKCETKKRIKPKKPRPPRPPGRSSSPGLREFVLQAIDNGNEQAGMIHNFVLNTWGYVAKRTLYGALSHLIFLDQILYTRMYNVRLYKRSKGVR